MQRHTCTVLVACLVWLPLGCGQEPSLATSAVTTPAQQDEADICTLRNAVQQDAERGVTVTLTDVRIFDRDPVGYHFAATRTTRRQDAAPEMAVIKGYFNGDLGEVSHDDVVRRPHLPDVPKIVRQEIERQLRRNAAPDGWTYTLDGIGRIQRPEGSIYLLTVTQHLTSLAGKDRGKRHYNGTFDPKSGILNLPGAKDFESALRI